MPVNLAWRGQLDSVDGIVFAPTRRRAQWLVVRSYWDAYGRRKGEWPRATVVRAPEFDGCPLAGDEPKFWSEDCVRDMTPRVL